MFLWGIDPNPLLSWRFDDPYGKPRVSFCCCDPLPDNQKEWYKVKESTALITFRLS